MGKRIKLIYILSLFSALMAISVQAYWLYNQYRYEVERYADEIAADVLRVGDEEFAERRKMAIGDDTSYIIDRSSRTQSGTSTIRNVQTQLCFDFKTDVLVDSIIGGQLNMTKLNLSFDATLPEDSIIHGVERNVVNYYIPFQVERLDSLLRARLSQYDFQIAFLPEGDTYSFIGSKDPVEVLIPLISNEMSFTVNAFALTVASKATSIHTVCVKNFFMIL